MGDLDDLDRLHAAATAAVAALMHGETSRNAEDSATIKLESVSAALYAAWPSISARLRAAEATVRAADATAAQALERLKAQQAAIEEAREALRAIAACDDAINKGDEPPFSRAEVAAKARAALEVTRG